MRFGRWYPLASAKEQAPAGPGVFQVRRATGLTVYPDGKSAMVHYQAAADLRAAAAGFAVENAGRDWLCRHAELPDAEAAAAAGARLLYRFQRQFGASPRPPSPSLQSCKLRLADRHARLVWDGGGVRDVEGGDLARLAEAAAPVLEAVARSGASLRAVSIDFAGGILRATVDVDGRVEPLRVDGDEFEQTIAPLCARLVAVANSLQDSLG